MVEDLFPDQGACAVYDGKALAKQGIVYVSINYRVGVFGFMAHPELTAESKHNSSGNYGLMDQIACIEVGQEQYRRHLEVILKKSRSLVNRQDRYRFIL
jgi:hypothetical protein